MTNPNAFALRAFRMDVKRNVFLNFEAVTFPNGPWAGCDVTLRRAAVCGITEESSDSLLGLDVLDKDGDIVQTLSLSRNAFEYLRRTLKLRREAFMAIHQKREIVRENRKAKR